MKITSDKKFERKNYFIKIDNLKYYSNRVNSTDSNSKKYIYRYLTPANTLYMFHFPHYVFHDFISKSRF